MKAASEKFPIVVRQGSAAVKIYRDQSKTSGTYYRVSFYMGSKRFGRNFTDLGEAKTEAKAKAIQLSRGDMDALHITGRDRLVYGRALEAIRPFDIALDAAAIEFAEAKKLLGGFALGEAARFYMKHHGRGIQAKPVDEAVAEMIAAKKEKGVSKAYVADLQYRLGTFQRAFHCNVNALVPDDIRQFLASLSLSARGYNNTLATLQTFIGFCKDRGWLGREVDVLAGIEKRREKAVPVEIFTPAEMNEILSNCSADLRPCLALGAFAGLRSEEILRLEWSDIDRRPGFVEIAAAKAKTAARRLVPIAANLAQWLAISDRNGTHVWPHSKPWFFESARDTVKAIDEKRAKHSKKPAQFHWKANGLRHSFISYRLAELQDVNKVALEAGNSPKIIFQHYRELCTPGDAKTWFSLGPEMARNVVAINAA